MPDATTMLGLAAQRGRVAPDLDADIAAPRRRILTVTMCYPTAARPEQGIFVQRRAAALTAHCDLRVIALRPWFPGLRPMPTADRDARNGAPGVRDVRMFYLPGIVKSLDARWFERALLREVSRIEHSQMPNLIDAHFEWPDGVGAWRAARRLRLPVVVTLRGKLVSGMREPGRRRHIVAMLRDADVLIAVSRSLARLACDVAGCELPIDVIPNGVDSSAFRPVDRTAAQARLDWPPAARWLVSVGHLQCLKGFDLLIEALPELRRRCGDVRLALIGGEVGEPRYSAMLRRRVRELQLDDAVRFAGRLPPERVNDALNAADLFVLASRSEGWCNALAEALAAGTPVVASDVGGNAEQLSVAACGSVFPRDDRAALVESLADALERDWNRAAIAAHGAKRSWARVARETLAVFERVLGAR